MRSLSGPVSARLASSMPGMAQFVEMQLTGGALYLNTTCWDITWNGHVWLGTFGVGRINPIEDQPGELKGLSFELAGIESSKVALVLSENVQGRPVIVYTVIFDANSQVIDGVVEWRGRLDTMAISESDGKAAISVTAEHFGIDLLRGTNVRFSDQDQQRVHPGDRFFEYMVAQADKKLVWPAASFFRK